MDPFAHTFTGAALAAAGLGRTMPLATAALIIGANAPDVDVVSWIGGRFIALEFRRGWTHGLLAIAVLPFVVTGALLLWHRLRRSARPAVLPVRASGLLALSALGVATHPSLDWLNNYGLRWLMPFDGTWFYGDTLFIVDPWIWLMLGGTGFLAYSRSRRALLGWSAFWMFASYMVLTSDLVRLPAQVFWLVGLFLLFALRRLSARWTGAGMEGSARVALALAGCYLVACMAANAPARAEVRAHLASLNIGPVGPVMVGPFPANPFRGTVVAETPTAYYLGRWNWLARPRFEFERDSIQRQAPGPAVTAASRSPEARRFLSWARFPYFEVSSDASGYIVRFGDARYASLGRGPVGVVTVPLDKDLRLRGRTE